MKMIEIKDVSFSYKNHEDKKEKLALDNINIDVKKGEFVGIIGHNGSGKSTLAKLLNAILLPDSGDVLIASLNTKDEKNIIKIRQTAGMVFQNPDNQIVASIVEEDVAFGPENLGVPKEEIRKRVDDALFKVDMSEFKNKKPYELSGGQKQRIAIAGILAMKPECIILDEPTAMLDPVGRMEVLNTLKELNKKDKTTLVLISHYMEELTTCDKIIVMDQGKIFKVASPKEIFKDARALEAISLEPPITSQIAIKLKEQGININTDVLSIDELVDEICQLK